MSELRLFEDEELWLRLLELAPQSTVIAKNLKLAKIFNTDREHTIFFLIEALAKKNNALLQVANNALLAIQEIRLDSTSNLHVEELLRNSITDLTKIK